MKSIKSYRAMKLASWDQSGKGSNVRRLFTQKEAEIWDMAFPYQDKRNDIGHAELVVYFAFKLLEYIKAKRAVVIPAAILHDVGWSVLIPKVMPKFEPFSEEFKKNEQIYRELHQKESVKISRKVLKDADYHEKYVPTILEIVAQHDTRKGFLCPEDGVVRDADKLWRFTLRQMQMDYMAKMSPKGMYNMRMRDIQKPSFFYSDISRHIARVELEQTLRYLTYAIDVQRGFSKKKYNVPTEAKQKGSSG